MKAKEIIYTLGKWAKPDLIHSWDNTGFQIGNSDAEIKKVLVALDLDREILDIAIEKGYEMIISHHPLIFKPLRSITDTNYKERLILDIIKNDILVYNAHSNLDLADNGVNDELARLLQLNSIEILSKDVKELVGSVGSKSYGYGRVGEVEEVGLEDFIRKVKETLDVDSLMVYGRTDRKVKKVAVCGGSGSDFIYDAYSLGADVYITGDIKYHEAQLAHELGLTIIDPGHFNTEKIILPVIKDYLDRELGGEIEVKFVMESGLPHKIY